MSRKNQLKFANMAAFSVTTGTLQGIALLGKMEIAASRCPLPSLPFPVEPLAAGSTHGTLLAIWDLKLAGSASRRCQSAMTSEAKPRNEKRMRQSCHDGSRTSSANDTHGAFPLYPLEASSKERLSEKHGNSRWHLSGAEVAESHSKSLAYNTNTTRTPPDYSS